MSLPNMSDKYALNGVTTRQFSYCMQAVSPAVLLYLLLGDAGTVVLEVCTPSCTISPGAPYGEMGNCSLPA